MWIVASLVFVVVAAVRLLPSDQASPPRFVVPDLPDLTIRTRQSFNLPNSTVVTEIVHLKRAWQRLDQIFEFHSPGAGQTHHRITITRCDERRILDLNDEARTYSSVPIRDRSESVHWLRIVTPRRPAPIRAGAGVTITVDAVDTGGRRGVGPFTARHVITTTTTKPSPGARARANKTVQDGWYIDLPPVDCREWGDGRTAMLVGSIAPDRVRIEHRGTARRGFPVGETTRMSDDRGETTESVELVELSDATLAASLFAVPPGYRPALPRLTGGFDLTRPDTLFNRAENYWEWITSWMHVFRW